MLFCLAVLNVRIKAFCLPQYNEYLYPPELLRDFLFVFSYDPLPCSARKVIF